MPEATKIQLVLNVDYAYEDGDDKPDPAVCKKLLNSLVALAANRGLLSGDHEFVVDEYSHEVVELPRRNPVLIHVRQIGEPSYLIGQAVPPSDEYDIDSLWSEWRATSNEPEADSDFIAWLVDENGWTEPLVESTYHEIEA